MSTLSDKAVLVTGATGFIGRHVVSRLLRQDRARLILLSRGDGREGPESAVKVRATLDGLSTETWLRAGVQQIDIVLHLGAFIPKVAADTDRVDDVYRANLIGTRALIESLPNIPERFVFASTVDVYAPADSDVLLRETSPISPSGLYGISKLFCEHLVHTLAATRGFAYSILRFGHIFGPGEEASQKLIPTMIRTLLRDEAPVLYGDGSAERDYLYVEDAVEALLRAATAESAQVGPVNIVRGSSVTTRALAEILVRLVGFKGEIRYVADKPAGRSLRFDNAEMRALLGQWNLVDLEQGLAREVEYFRSLK
jgi:nucleoside-diphosphate-sugar epimerase